MEKLVSCNQYTMFITMSQRILTTALSLMLGATIFTSCTKNEFSSDDAINPSVVPSIVIGSDNNVVYGIHPVTGLKNWERSLPNSIYASPLVHEGSVYIGTVNYSSASAPCDTLYKLNGNTGAIIKKIGFGGGAAMGIKSTPIAIGKYIYVATTNNNVYAIDTTNYSNAWTFAADAPIESSITLLDDNLVFASTGGTVYNINKNNGTLIWSVNLGAGLSITSSPCISNPFVYVGASDSSMYCLYLNCPSSTGLVKWSYKTKGKITSSPACKFGKCVFGSTDFNIYCLDTATSGLIWKFPTNSNVNSSPVIQDQTVYVASNDYNLYSLNIINGSMKWKYATNGLVKSSPLCYKGVVYVGSYDKYLYAVDSAYGSLKWSANINGQIQCSPTANDFTSTHYSSQISGYTN